MRHWRRFVASQAGQGRQWLIVLTVWLLALGGGWVSTKEVYMDASATGLISLIVWLLLGCLAFGIAVWIVGVMNLPNPTRQIVLALVGILALILVLYKMGVIPL